MEPNPLGGLDFPKCGNAATNDQISEKQCIIEIDNDEHEKVLSGKSLTVRLNYWQHSVLHG